jgi:gliding motility-associated-like protein
VYIQLKKLVPGSIVSSRKASLFQRSAFPIKQDTLVVLPSGPQQLSTSPPTSRLRTFFNLGNTFTPNALRGILTALFLVVFTASFAQTVYYANSVTGNDANSGLTAADSKKTFKGVYAVATANSIIDLTGTFSWEMLDEDADNGTTGFTLSKNLTIRGQGADQTFIQAHTTQTSADRRVFTVDTGVTLLFEKLTIRNGKTTQEGGGIYNLGTTTLTNCRITNNSANTGGGGISHMSATTLTLTGCTLDSNSANAGGAIKNGSLTGGAVNLTISNSTFAFNTQTATIGTFGGGALWILDGTTRITNATFAHNNLSVGSGRGPSIWVRSGTVHLKNNIFVKSTVGGNTASLYDEIEALPGGGTVVDNGFNIFGRLSESITLASTSWVDSRTGANFDDSYTKIGDPTKNCILNIDRVLRANGATNGTFTLETTGINIDNGSTVTNDGVSIPSEDQRGSTRTSTPDIGAYEYLGSGLFLTCISPTSGPVGASVTLEGIGFSATSSDNVVYFGGTKATLTSTSTTQIVAAVPSGQTNDKIVVLNTSTGLSASSKHNFLTTVTNSAIRLGTSFAPQIDVATASPTRVKSADFDGDGKLDLVVVNKTTNNGISIYQNTSSGSTVSFSSTAITLSGIPTNADLRDLVIADFDGDGKLDLATQDYLNAKVYVFRNTGSLVFSTALSYTTEVSPNDVATGDVNGDGKLDLVTGNYSVFVSFSFLRNISTVGTIAFATKQDFGISAPTTAVALGDIDGDGKQDVITSTFASPRQLKTYLTTSSVGASTLSFATSVNTSTISDPWEIDLADLDRDGDLDVIVKTKGSDEGVSIFMNNSTPGNVSYGSELRLHDGSFYNVSVGDVNGDGKVDILVNEYSEWRVFVNTYTSGVFTASNFSQTNVTHSLVTTLADSNPFMGDFNNDGRQDIGFSGTSSGTRVRIQLSVLSPSITVSDNTLATMTSYKTPRVIADHSLVNADVSITATDLVYVNSGVPYLLYQNASDCKYYRSILSTSSNLSGVTSGSLNTFLDTYPGVKAASGNFPNSNTEVTFNPSTGQVSGGGTFSTLPFYETFTVSGANLIGNLTISPLINLQISTNQINWFGHTTTPTQITLTPSSGTVSTTTIYVRLNPLLPSPGTYSGNITLASTGVSPSSTKAVTAIISSNNITTQAPTTKNSCLNDVTGNTLSIVAAGTGLTYQWFSNSTNSTTGGTSLGSSNGAQTATLTYSTASTGTTYYYCVVTGTCGSVTSTISAVTINPVSVGGTASADASSVCTNSTTVLRLTGHTGTTIQWQQSADGSTGWANVTGGSNSGTATYTTGAIGSTRYFRAVVTSGACALAYSSTVAVSVISTIVGGTATAAAPTVCSGGTTTLSLTGNTGTIQWQQSADGSTGWANVTGGTGATTASYTTPALTSTTYYRAVVSSGVCTPATSSTVTVTVSPASVAGTASAAASTVCSGGTTTLSLTGNTGTIQWQQSADGSTGWANVTGGTGETTASYTTAALTSTTYYRAVVTSGSCTSATSSTLTLTVSPASVAGTASAAASTVCSGGTTTLSLTGQTGAIQWQQSADGSTGWANVTGGTGATTTSYTTAALTSTTYFRALVTSGACASATSSTVIVSMCDPTLSLVSGNNQTGPVNQKLGAGPILKVLNTDGTAAANVSLTVTANSGQINRPVLSNIANSYSTGGTTINNLEWKAHQFTTGNTSITLDKVDLVLNVADSILTSPLVPYSYPKTVQVEAAIYSLVNGLPAVEIGTSGIQSALLPATATWKTLVFTTQIELSPNTSYALVVKSDNVTGFKWGNVRPNTTSPSGLVTYLNAAAYSNSNWSTTVTNNQNITSPVNVGNGFSLKGFTPLSATQTLVTNANGTAALGSWVLGDRAGAQQLVVTNSSILGSPLTITATATAVVPSAPTNLSYSPSNGQVVLSFTAAYDGGATLSNYEYSLDNGTTWTALNPVDVSSPITITGLSNGVTYPLRIRAVNSAGSGAASAAINVVTVIPLSNQSITIDPIANQTYTGAAITPSTVVKDGNTTLGLGTDYTVSYTSNTNVGTATVRITGTGNYTGTKTQTFGIVAKAASTLTIDAIANQTYTGVAITPSTVVKDGNTTLTLGTDYTVAYTSNTIVGTANVTITGTGNYTGTKTQTFAIVAKSASTLTIEAIANQMYTGSALTPAIVVKDGATTLTLGTDYTVAYSSNTNVGTANVTITGTGNYTGTKTQTFAIVAKAASTLTIDAIANQTYTGSAITPMVVLKDGATTLTLGTDYTVAYTSNTNLGTATLTITGIGNYTGIKTQTFSIVSKSASTLTIDAIANQTYTGSDITPSVVVKDGSTTLTENTDYTIAYMSNINVGTATATITGIGNYSGTNIQPFTITPRALTIRATNSSKIYGEANPSLSFSYSGLVAGDSDIDQVPSISTTATTTSGAGNYPITLTGGSDPNYILTRVDGVLEVTPSPLSLAVTPATKIYGQADPRFTYSLQGLKGTDTEVVLRGALTRELGENPGSYRINQGTLSAGPNYTLTVTGSTLEITKARALSVLEMAQITTDWSKEADLPAKVDVLATHGQFYKVEVKWDKSTLNLLARGAYLLTGTLILPGGIENPDQVKAKLRVQVLPKAAPQDVTITTSSFVGSTTSYFISVGDFVVNDPVDKIHTVSLLGPGYDNKYFEIKNNILFWSSADLAAGKTTFSIIVRVTDRDGNTLDKFFEISRTRPSITSLEVANTFSPNGDRFNDTWGIEGARFYSGTTLQIFDRGGTRVFNTEDPSQRWDGTYSGKELPIGTYYWTLNVAETGEMRRGVLNVLKK